MMIFIFVFVLLIPSIGGLYKLLVYEYYCINGDNEIPVYIYRNSEVYVTRVSNPGEFFVCKPVPYLINGVSYFQAFNGEYVQGGHVHMCEESPFSSGQIYDDISDFKNKWKLSLEELAVCLGLFDSEGEADEVEAGLYLDLFESAVQEVKLTSILDALYFASTCGYESQPMGVFEEQSSGEFRPGCDTIDPDDGNDFLGRGAVKVVGRCQYELVESKWGVDITNTILNRQYRPRQEEYAFTSGAYVYRYVREAYGVAQTDYDFESNGIDLENMEVVLNKIAGGDTSSLIERKMWFMNCLGHRFEKNTCVNPFGCGNQTSEDTDGS